MLTFSYLLLDIVLQKNFWQLGWLARRREEQLLLKEAELLAVQQQLDTAKVDLARREAELRAREEELERRSGDLAQVQAELEETVREAERREEELERLRDERDSLQGSAVCWHSCYIV